MPSSKIIIGIDPGIALTGYGIIETEQQQNKIKVLEYGVIRTSEKKIDSERLVQIHEELSSLLKQYQPQLAGCEKIFFSKNIKTATTVAQARGVILLTLKKHKLDIKEITPNEVKQAITGYGKADKKQIQFMTQQILKLQDKPIQDDAADALAIAITIAALSNYDS